MMDHRSTPRLHDVALQARLDREGVVVVDLLGTEQIAGLAEAYRCLVPRTRAGFTSSLLSPDAELRRGAHCAIGAIVAPALSRVLHSHRAVLFSFAVRAAGSLPEDMPLHQDWSFVDESSALSLGVWSPLVDVDGTNGCLIVVKGSHAAAHPPRPVGGAFQYPEIKALLNQRYLQPLPLRAGQAAIFDQRLFHCSSANTTPVDRIAVGAVVLPHRTSLQIYRTDSEGRVTGTDVPDSYYLDTQVLSPTRD